MRRFYWFKDGLPQSVAILGIAVLYPLFIFLMGDPQRGFLEYLEMATWYLVAMAVFMPVIFNLLIYGTTVPLTLSLGATRKEAWTGLQLYRLAMLLPLLGGVVLLAVLGATMDFWLVFVLLLSGYLFFGGIGGILGVLGTKLSRGALVAVTAAISTCSLAVAAVAALLTVLAEQVAFSLIFILPVVGLLVYIACTCFEKKAIKALCVK